MRLVRICMGGHAGIPTSSGAGGKSDVKWGGRQIRRQVAGGGKSDVKRKRNGDLAPLVWMAFMPSMQVMTVCSGVCSYARHELQLRWQIRRQVAGGGKSDVKWGGDGGDSGGVVP